MNADSAEKEEANSKAFNKVAHLFSGLLVSHWEGMLTRTGLLVATPNPNWGSITNTSIEGGKTNPGTGIRGDWSGTVFHAIFVACGFNEECAGMFYGNVWKKVIIQRQENWIGIRSEPTFPRRGITLQGKTYFLDQQQ
jgi:hypothetical protein